MNTDRNFPTTRVGLSRQAGSSGRFGTPALTRRQLFQLLGITGLGTGLAACSNDSPASSTSTRDTAVSGSGPGGATASPKGTATKSGSKTKRRVLVVVELQGGNDGFATLVPYADARFRKLRDRVWVDPKELVLLDDRYAMAKGLEPMKGRLAFLEGVGVAKPDLSHFAMSDRWWRGDPDGLGNVQTGFPRSML